MTIETGTAKRRVVLVAEDEPIILMLAMDIVEEAGFEAVTATNAADAISILESRSDISVLFTDIDMRPGMDGAKLAALVRNRWPPVRIIIVSGVHNPSDFDLPENALFFTKPYRPEAIVKALQRDV